MSSFLDNIQPAVKKETRRVAISTITGVVLMWIAFAVLQLVIPEKVPFDHTVILGGIGGGIIAVLNFFLMGMTVQKIASETDEDRAKMWMKNSYSKRMLMQMVWVIVAIVVPCFQFVAGIVPLLFPGIGIKILGIMKR